MFAKLITFLYVADLDRSAAFYEETLGLPRALDQGTCRIYEIAERGYLGVCACSDRRPRPADSREVIVTFVTDDVDGWYERLSAKGVAFEHPPRENPKFAIYHCFLRDPDGYLLEIQRFLNWP